MKHISVFILLLTLANLLLAQDKEKSRAFEVRGWSLSNCDQEVAFDEDYIMQMLEEAPKYNINYFELLGPYYNQPERLPIDSMITYRKFPKLNQSKTMKRDLDKVKLENEKFNRICNRADELGIDVTVWLHELWYPTDILEFYPEMGDGHGNVVYSSPEFQRFFESKFTELFETIPSLDGLVLTISESITMSIMGLRSSQDRYKFSSIDAFAHLVNKMADICDRYGKVLYVRAFGTENEARYKMFQQAFLRINSKVRVHQKTCAFGDWWNIYQKTNPRLGDWPFKGRFVMAEEELGMEYYGMGSYPIYIPELIMQRLDVFRKRNVKNAPRGVVARIDRRWNRSWDNQCRANIIAFSRIADEPEGNISEYMQGWFKSYYGPTWMYAKNALVEGTRIFYDSYFIHPGEKEENYRWGRVTPIENAMDPEHGPFKVMKEMGWKTQKQLAIARGKLILQELDIAQNMLDECNPEQKKNFADLRESFEKVQDWVEYNTMYLSVLDAYRKLIFDTYNSNMQEFAQAVKDFRKKYDPKGENKDINGFIKSIKIFKNIDPSLYSGYMGGIQAEDLQLELDVDESN